MIPHSRPCLGEEEEAAVLRVLRSGQLAQGPEVAGLERELAAALALPRALALSHGTAALHLGLLALEVRPGDPVLLPSYACVSLLHAVVSAGARPVLVDCQPGGPDLDLERARAELESGRARALVVANPFGRPAELGPWARQLPILEDGTHSLGLRGLRTPAAAYSFSATKMISGGEGGALVLDHEPAHRLALDLRDYDGRDDYRVRYNYKLDELSAAVLRVQLQRLGGFSERRRHLAALYASQLEGLEGLRPLPLAPGQVVYRYVVSVSGGRLPGLQAALKARGVQARRPVYRPLHHYLGLDPAGFPQSQRWWEECLSLPLYPALSESQLAQVVEALRAELNPGASLRPPIPPPV